MRRAMGAGLLLAGVALFGASMVVAADPPEPEMEYRAFAPAVSKAEAVTATSTPPPPTATPYTGPVVSLSLASGGVPQSAPVEPRDVDHPPSGPIFQEPTHPGKIAWYNRYGHPGWRGNNSLFAAHINYAGYGDGPFARLTSTRVDDALYVTMANGQTYTYTVKSVQVIHLDDLDMPSIVYPPLDPHTERVTLISCGGTFVPLPGGGGVYDSRVFVMAERYVP